MCPWRFGPLVEARGLSANRRETVESLAASSLCTAAGHSARLYYDLQCFSLDEDAVRTRRCDLVLAEQVDEIAIAHFTALRTEIYQQQALR